MELPRTLARRTKIARCGAALARASRVAAVAAGRHWCGEVPLRARAGGRTAGGLRLGRYISSQPCIQLAVRSSPSAPHAAYPVMFVTPIGWGCSPPLRCICFVGTGTGLVFYPLRRPAVVFALPHECCYNSQYDPQRNVGALSRAQFRVEHVRQRSRSSARELLYTRHAHDDSLAHAC